MGAMKNYLIDLITSCVPDVQFAQDAIEHAIFTGRVMLTYDKDKDIAQIMSQYDDLVEVYQNHIQRNTAALLESYGPLLTVIERRVA